MNCARSYFYQYANHLPNHLLSIELKYPDFFLPLFDSFFSFYIILCKLSSFMRIYAFQRKKTSRKRCVYNHGNLYLFRFTYAYLQITVHPPDFAGDKNIDFEFPNACLLGHPFILAIKILKAKLQTFHSNVLMRESLEKCSN